MKKMMLAKIGIPFKINNIPFDRSIKLHKCTQILSVSVKKDKDKDEYVLWINYMYPTRASSKSSYQEFHFIIAGCYTEIKIDNHNYIGSFDIEDKIYAVLYKAGEIIKN